MATINANDIGILVNVATGQTADLLLLNGNGGRSLAYGADGTLTLTGGGTPSTASLLIKHGVPLKVVSERLGHAKASFTMDTYQHVMPGMQADAARTYERIVTTHTASTARPASTGSAW